MRVEAQNPGNSIYPQLYIYDVAGNYVTNVGGDYYGNVELDNFAMPKTGTYFIKVYSNNNTAAYQMRVDQAVAGGVTQLNATPNGSQASSTLLNVSSLNVGSYSGNAAARWQPATTATFILSAISMAATPSR